MTASAVRRVASILPAILAIALAGALLFGLWHVVVGGLVNGNPRAAAFGAVLAGASLVLLGVGAALRLGGRSRRAG